MDKNVIRSFSLLPVNNEEESYNMLQMDSLLDGEYGPVALLTTCNLDSRYPSIHCVFTQISAENYQNLHPFMQHELYHFMRILPLFYPLTKLKDEVPQSQASESQNP